MYPLCHPWSFCFLPFPATGIFVSAPHHLCHLLLSPTSASPRLKSPSSSLYISCMRHPLLCLSLCLFTLHLSAVLLNNPLYLYHPYLYKNIYLLRPAREFPLCLPSATIFLLACLYISLCFLVYVASFWACLLLLHIFNLLAPPTSPRICCTSSKTPTLSLTSVPNCFHLRTA